MSYYSFTAQIKGVEVHKLWHYVRGKLHSPDDFLGKEFEVTIAIYMNKIATLFACQGADLNTYVIVQANNFGSKSLYNT